MRRKPPELIADPQSRIVQRPGANLNALGSDHVGVHHVGVSPVGQPNKRYMYHGLVVGPCVHVAPYTAGEEFVFVEEQRPLATTKGVVVQKFLGFPGGFADGITTSLAAEAHRELVEEAGIKAYDALIPLRQGTAINRPSFHPYPQLSDEESYEYLAPGAVLATDEELAELRAKGEGTETHLQVVTMPIPKIERILSGQQAAEVPFSGPAITTFCMAQLALRNL